MGSTDVAATSEAKAWLVTGAATATGLALGVLYIWSVVRAAIPDAWHWSNSEKALPYAVACLVFSLTMIPAGRLQDRWGPRLTASLGGVLTGCGCVLAGLSQASLTGFVVGFGLLSGAGIGFGYAAATPVAVKWHPAERTGLVAGLVVAGFGLAPVVAAPLTAWLLGYFAAAPWGGLHPVSAALVVLGGIFFVVVVALAQLLENPQGAQAGSPRSRVVDVSWRAMLQGGQFYLLWCMYFAGAAAGLTFVGVAQSLGKQSLGELAFLAVVVLAIGNAIGRIVAGALSDRIGRQVTLCLFFVLQSLTVATLYATRQSGSWPGLLTILFVLGASYGANLAVFPSVTKDLYGLAGFGLNYGFLFTAWGLAGLTMPWLNGRVQDLTGSEGWSYGLIEGLLVAAVGLTFVARKLDAGRTNEVAT